MFTRSTWAVVGILLTLAALEVGRRLPATLDPRVAVAGAAAAAWVVLGLLVVADLRARRRATARAAAAAAEPSALARKLEHLATLSHEIRTPITSILGYTDVLCTEAVSPREQLAHLETIRRNGDHLLRIVRDVLDLTRLDAEPAVPACVETDVPALLRDVLDLVRAEATEEGVAVELRASGPVPAAIATDPTRVKQILANLVANAVHYTGDGTVGLVVGTGEGRLTIDVVDRGPGLSEDEQAAIFEPWMQGDLGAARVGGSGLGLAVARGFARLLGGDVTVESALGGGCVFRLALPLGAQAAPLLDPETAFARPGGAPVAAEPDVRLHGRVLLVEDGVDTRALLDRFLARAGCDVVAVADGRAGLDAVTAAEEAGRPFDLVLMDMEMPVLDGWQAARELRARGVRVPLVALTAFGGAARVAACLEAGCTEVLEKPATRAELLDTVRRHLAGAPSAATDRQQAEPAMLGALPQTETLMRMFVAVLERRVEEMEEALATGESDRLGRLAERLRGTAGSYGLVAISDAAAVLEAAARQGRDVRRCLDRLAETCRQVRAAYRPGRPSGSA